MKKFYICFVFLGILIIAYPKVNNFYNSYNQQKLLQSFKQVSPVTIDDNLQSNYQAVNQVLNKGETIDSGKITKSQPDKVLESENLDVIGTLSINKIELILPIVEGSSDKDLKYAAGHLIETAPIGKKGNAAIAAHRSYTYGKFFNRLDELESGDEIVIQTLTDNHVYSVFNKIVVLPTDMSVLSNLGDDSYITLITCDPIKNPTHRLIVQAQKKNDD
nr:class D sortase [Bacillus sp. SM2101]